MRSLEGLVTKILKIDAKYFLRGGFWLSFGLTASMVISIVISIIFANKLSPDVYGQYRYLSSVIGILGVFTLTGLGQSLTRAVAAKKEGSLIEAFQTQIFWSIPASAIGLFLTLFALYRGNHIYSWTFFTFSLTFPLISASSLYDDLLRGRGNFSLSTIYSQILSVSTNLMLGFSAFLAPNYFLVIFPSIFIIQLFFNCLFFYKLSLTIAKKSSADKGLITFGKHLSITNILGTVADQIDATLLFLVGGPEKLAIYSFAIAGPEIIKGFFKQIVPLSIPKLSKFSWKYVNENLLHHLIKIFFLSLIAVTIYVFLSPTMFSVVFPQYTESTIYSQIFALSLLTTPGYLIIAAIQSHKRIREIYVYNIGSPSINIILTFVLTFNFGLWGLIMARVIGRYIGLLILLIIFFKNRNNA